MAEPAISQRERHAYRRALTKAISAVAKGSGWNARDGTLFRSQDGWFVSVLPYVDFSRHATAGWVTVKPMACDDAFWQIIGHPELAEQPLSFRANGGLTCRPPWIAQTEVDGDPDPHTAAQGLLGLGQAHLDRATAMSVEEFVDFCRSRATAGQPYSIPILSALVGAGRYDRALAECAAARAAGSGGNFSKNGKNLIDLVTEWIEAHP